MENDWRPVTYHEAYKLAEEFLQAMKPTEEEAEYVRIKADAIYNAIINTFPQDLRPVMANMVAGYASFLLAQWEREVEFLANQWRTMDN